MSKRARQPATILLVDDHPLVRKGLRSLLESESGFTVVGEAGDGEEALQRVKALRPDVVVMDVSMPGMSGIEATGRVLAESRATKVVTLSMHSEKRFVDDMLKAGAAAYVLKDSAPEDLVGAIRAALRGECFLSPPILGTVVSGYRQSVEGAAPGPFILQTKLHRPTLPGDVVSRTSVLDRLDAGRDFPLTLVSAPAGYGKSLLIASWLERTTRPGAWLALDPEDGDAGQFVSYVAAAVRRVFPDACQDTMRLAAASAAAPVATLAATLSNELEALPRSMILVLDDYHRIGTASPVNELLQQMLTRPPGRLHLVIITRRDPPIPLSLLRARGQVNEIRMRDLRFDAAESRALLEASVRFPLTDEALAQVERELEGWVAGLRLVALSLRKDQDATTVLQHLRGGVQHAQQYLTHEAVAGQPPEVRDWLLKTAILDRFCAPLCAAVCAGPDDPDAAAKGARFVRTLSDENLFVIPLDAEGQWFRYHQLFQELLAAELKGAGDAAQVAALHVRASEWFERQDVPDEAMKHALAAGDVERAAQVVARYAHAMVNEGRVHVLGRWLSQLPPELVQGRAALLRAEAWRLYLRMERGSLPATVDRLEDLTRADAEGHGFALDIAALRGWCALLANDATLALEFSENALALAPSAEDRVSRSLAEMVFGLAGQMQGQRERVSRALTRWLVDRSARDPIGEIRLAQTLAFASYIAADPPGAEALLERARKVAAASGQVQLLPLTNYLAALFQLQRGEFEAALPALGDARQRQYLGRSAIDGMCAQVIGYQLQGKAEQAVEAFNSVEAFVGRGHPWLAPVAEACQVRLALLQGRADAGAAWLRTSSPPAADAMLWWFEVPALTWCRALMADGTVDRLVEAEQRLLAHAQVNEAQHNTYQLIGILCELAVARAKLDRAEEADSTLQQALTLAEPGGFVFPFLEAGSVLLNLLRGVQAEHDEFPARLLRVLESGAGAEARARQETTDAPVFARQQRTTPAAARSIIEALTNRELDILELLAERFQNKEIAARLSIAPETVNYHLKHIYQKLNVQSRRRAVTAATELGLLHGRPGRRAGDEQPPRHS